MDSTHNMVNYVLFVSKYNVESHGVMQLSGPILVLEEPNNTGERHAISVFRLFHQWSGWFCDHIFLSWFTEVWRSTTTCTINADVRRSMSKCSIPVGIPRVILPNLRMRQCLATKNWKSSKLCIILKVWNIRLINCQLENTTSVSQIYLFWCCPIQFYHPRSLRSGKRWGW